MNIDGPDDGYAEIVEHLRGLPEGTVLRWADDHITSEQPWCASWVDVRVPEIEQAAGLSWVWTVVGEDDEDAETGGPTVLAVAHDMEVEGLWGPLPDGGDWYQDEVLLEKGAAPQPEDAARWAAKIAEDDRYRLVRQGAWTPQRVTEAIKKWVLVHANRNDIRFVWDPDTVGPSAMLQEATRRMREIKDGGESYDVGDGIKVHPDAMDQFLAMDPDASAELMAGLKGLIGRPDKERPERA